MNGDTNSQQKQATSFTVINNVRNNCKQPVTKKLLMLTLATYANADGICYPSNKALATATGISRRTIQRMLPALADEGEIEILTPGIGRDKKRLLRLTRYAGKGDITVSCLNAPRSLGKAGCNSHIEQPLRKGEGASVDARASFFPRIRYPESKEEMHEMLEGLGIEPNPDYDGNFFAQMEASNWTIQGQPVWDWPATYAARLEKTSPQNWQRDP